MFRIRNGGLHRRRRAGVVLELLLSLPILVIALLAAIQFGMFFSKSQQLALASRVGARAAAETVGLPTSNGPVPANILQSIERQLNQSGVNSFGVLVEHNVANPAPMTPIQLASGSPNATAPAMPLPNSAPFVRVTVAVQLGQIMPDLLGMFGYDISGDVAQQTTVYRYEL